MGFLKKRTISLFLLLVAVIVVSSVTASMVKITGISIEKLTGEVSSRPVNISIFVAPAQTQASITILNPVDNRTYISQPIFLEYTSNNADAVWYNLDGTPNMTLYGSTYIGGLTNGNHSVYLYANDSSGNIASDSVTFFINSSMLSMDWDGWWGDDKFGSTNFSNYSYEELQNLSGITFHDTNFGEIFFDSFINITDDMNPYDGQINFDDYIFIYSNRIEINTTALPNFNKTATLKIYNLTLKNPQIARDGVVCPATICTINSYTGGTLAFTVGHFTSYSAEESSSSESSSSSLAHSRRKDRVSGALGTSEIGAKQSEEILRGLQQPETVAGGAKEKLFETKDTATLLVFERLVKALTVIFLMVFIFIFFYVVGGGAFVKR